MAVPFAVPAEIDGPSAWYGPQVASRTDWVHLLGAEEVAEVESAASALEESGLEPSGLARERFPLPTLGPRLGRILAEVLNGRGFALLRGLPVREWGPRRSALAFLGLGLHLGNLRPQNARGHLLGHVRDEGLSSRDPNVRIYQTR